MKGPCMCGDTHCPSCGPLLGNWKCPLCHCWSDDGCEHINDDGTDLKPEFHAQAEAIAKAEADADAQYAADLEAEEQLWQDWQARKD